MMNPYYDDGRIVVYHGDCREFISSLPRPDSIVTDPPFKLSQSYSKNVDADNLEAVAAIQDASRLTLKAVEPGALAAIFYDNRIMPFGLDAFRRAGWQYLRMLAFYRRWGNAHKLHGWMSTTDPVLVFAAPGEKPSFHEGGWAHDCYTRTSPEREETGHGAQKPLEFVTQIVERLTPKDGLVLDPFMGSATTLRAAQLSGRRAIGIESEERYCEKAVRRLCAELNGRLIGKENRTDPARSAPTLGG
jgi:site-specific DNA-methyltransferase (adenine-specific)